MMESRQLLPEHRLSKAYVTHLLLQTCAAEHEALCWGTWLLHRTKCNL